MMQQIKKWDVLVLFKDVEKKIEFYIHDNHSSNVLRIVSSMSFKEEPTVISISTTKDN